MTMARSEHLKRGLREKELRNFHEKLNLNETAQHQQQQTDLQGQLLKNQCHTAAHEGDGDGKVQYNQYSEVHGSMEKLQDHRHREAQVDGEMAPQAKPVGSCINHLLILAQSAEIVAQSEDSWIGGQTDNKNKGSNNDLVDRVSQDNGSNITADDSCESNQRNGFCYEVTRPRLTQIRKQARHKHLLLDQERIEDSQWKDVHGKTVRLNQIKHHARCKSKTDLLLQEEKLQEKIIRLSQMKHLARLKGKSITKERTKEHMDGHVQCARFKDNKKEKAIARQFEEEDICQGEGNLIAIASGKGQKRTYFKEKIQRHLKSKSSGPLSVQNNVLNSTFTNSANTIFLHCETNMRWLPYMHHMQLKECHCNVAYQHKAEYIKGKRASKDDHQYSKNSLQSEATPIAELHHKLLIGDNDSKHLANSLCFEGNSERQKEFDCPKGRMRLTQLRREVRLGNQCYARQESAES